MQGLVWGCHAVQLGAPVSSATGRACMSAVHVRRLPQGWAVQLKALKHHIHGFTWLLIVSQQLALRGRACAAQANVIASLLRGYKPNLSPLKDQPMFPPGAFSKAPKPTGTFIPQNDPLLSKQPHGTVPFFNKPDLSLDYPLVTD